MRYLTRHILYTVIWRRLNTIQWRRKVPKRVCVCVCGGGGHADTYINQYKQVVFGYMVIY